MKGSFIFFGVKSNDERWAMCLKWLKKIWSH